LIFQEGNPDIYIPNLGYVNFLIATGNVLSWSVDLAVKKRAVSSHARGKGGALRVEGTPRSGVTWQLSPVYALTDDSVTYSL